ncbi:MAG: two-component system response regulator, partial [Myxococcales bacterium]
MRPQVLLVHPDARTRVRLGQALSRGGFEVVECADAAQGRAALRRARAVSLAVLGAEAAAEPALSAALEAAGVALLVAGRPRPAPPARRRPGAGPVPETDGEPGERATLLVVDDSLTFRHALSAQLREAGYDVVLAETGEEALSILKNRSDIDCILLDMILPGLSGEETCRMVKSEPETRRIPVILLTALEGLRPTVEGLLAGADDFVAKSGEPAVLLARVRAHVRRKKYEDENRRMRDALARQQLALAEAEGARRLAEARQALLVDLERKNRELECA